MNKKLLAIVMTTFMFLTFVGCNTVATPDESGMLDLNNQTTDPTNDFALDAIPGVVENPNADPNPLDETESTPAGNNARPSESTNPSTDGNEDREETTPPATGEEEEPEDSTPPEIETTSYEHYLAMSPDEQVAFFNTFDSMEDFVAWYNAAKAEYEAQHPDIDIGDGNIDIGDIIEKP